MFVLFFPLQVLMLLINLIQDDDNKKLLVSAKAPANFESIFPC